MANLSREIKTLRTRLDDLGVTAFDDGDGAARRRGMPVRLLDHYDDGNDGVAERTPDERLAMMWQLTRDAWAFTEHAERAESRLQRHVVRAERRER